MEFVPLTEDQRREFERDGFLVVRKALDAARLERLLAAADRLAEPFLSKPEVRNRPEYNHIDLRPGLLREEAVLDLVDHAPTVALVAQLLGPNIHLHSHTLICKRPEDLGGTAFRRGWHRDVRIPADLGNDHLPRVGIKVCYCLTDFHQGNSGMTKMIRGTHLRHEPLVMHGDEVDPRELDVVDHHVDAGDAILFENRIFHTAAPNLGDRTSKVFIFGYAYRWMKQEIYLDPPHWLDPPKTTRLVGADPTRRQLLGGCPDIDVRPWALEHWAKKHGVVRTPVPWTVKATTP
jgi:ectoine hydroxylase